MKLQKRIDDEVGFQMGPMIDMVFLLLVFFMVTTKISKEKIKLDINLPVASNGVLPKDQSNRDIISIDGQGQYYVGQKPVGKKELEDYMKARFKNDAELKLYVRADKGTPGKQIKELMRLAAEAGAINVIFASYKE